MLRPGGGEQVRSPMIRVRPGPRNGVEAAASPGSISERTFGIPSPSRTRCRVTSRQPPHRLSRTSLPLSGNRKTHNGSAACAGLRAGAPAARPAASRADRKTRRLIIEPIMPPRHLRNRKRARNDAITRDAGLIRVRDAAGNLYPFSGLNVLKQHVSGPEALERLPAIADNASNLR